MKNIIIGTAGHVDHGKTQLTKALSGIDTDRLAEEQKRGITIELGFAHIPNDEGYNIGVIDVPGHEKFIKNMLAGIGGIDFVIFVVAADEGIMPQTKEHFEILQALGIDDGIVAITKCDMVDEEWMELLLDDVTDYFKGSFLEGKPMVQVSAKTGQNIDLLKAEILKKCDREAKRIEDPELFRLPIDRVFTMSGFGTVVTGTLIDGRVSVNDEIVVYPEGTKVKVRGIQTYGSDVDTAIAGQRTAINLANIKKEDLSRGDVIAAEHAVSVTNMIDAKLSIFESSDRQVLNNSRVHLYVGSKEILAKVILLDRDVLTAGETCYVQFRLEEPIALRRGDRFIIRFYSPVITIGGGIILDAEPDKHKRNKENVLEALSILDGGSLEDILVMKTGQRRYYKAADLAYDMGVLPDKLFKVLEEVIAEGRIIRLEDGTLLSRERMERMAEGMENMIRAYHEENPLAAGVPKQELLSRLKDFWHIDEEKIVSSVVTYGYNNGKISDRGTAVALTDFHVEFTPAQQKLKSTIAEKYRQAGLEMIKNDELYALDDDKRVVVAILSDLAEEGVITKVDPSYFVITEGWQAAVDAARQVGAEKGNFTLADYRDQLDTSRKYASVLLQSLDKAGITIFNGETRSVQPV